MMQLLVHLFNSYVLTKCSMHYSKQPIHAYASSCETAQLGRHQCDLHLPMVLYQALAPL